jgi:hypothetical protein
MGHLRFRQQRMVTMFLARANQPWKSVAVQKTCRPRLSEMISKELNGSHSFLVKDYHGTEGYPKILIFEFFMKVSD